MRGITGSLKFDQEFASVLETNLMRGLVSSYKIIDLFREQMTLRIQITKVTQILNLNPDR